MRSSTLPPGVLVIAALVVACGGVLNPNFDEPVGGATTSTATSTSTSTSPSTSSSTSTTTTTTTTTGGESEGDASSSTGSPELTTTGAPATAFCPGVDEVAAQTMLDFACAQVDGEPRIPCLTPTSWAKAEGACAALCGRLAVAPDEGSRLAVHAAFLAVLSDAEKAMTTIDDQPALSTASAWVGACAEDGVFTWIDGTPMPATPGQDGWGPQDPDEPPSSCVIMVLFGKGAANGYWHDRDPGLAYRFICEAGGPP